MFRRSNTVTSLFDLWKLLFRRMIASPYLIDLSSHMIITSANFGFDNLCTDFMTFRLTLITCENPVLSPPDYIVDASSCKNGNSTAYNSTFSSRNAEGYSDVMVAADLVKVPDLCCINLINSAPGSVMQEKKDFSLSILVNFDFIHLSFGFF